jgi:hypothetical protein
VQQRTARARLSNFASPGPDINNTGESKSKRIKDVENVEASGTSKTG